MKVLFLIRSMGRGGAERQLSLLARALKDRGCDVAVAVFYARAPLERELLDAGVEIIDLGKTGRWDNHSVAARFLGEVNVRRPEIVYSFLPASNVFCLLLRPFFRCQGVQVVCGIRSEPSGDGWRLGRVAGWVDLVQRWLLPAADAVISNSHAGLRAWESCVKKGRKAVVENGVEVERFTFSASCRHEQRSRWQVKDGQKLIGLVGRIAEQKNHALLLDALAMLREGRPEMLGVFVGAGDPELKEHLAARSCELGLSGRVIWAGPSDDLAAVYSALDVLCLPSIFEGFPNVLAEAMAVGVPCVATDVGDCRVLIGDLGWIVPPGDVDALAAALDAAAAAAPTWDRERSRRQVAERFSVDAMVGKTLDLLLSLPR